MLLENIHVSTSASSIKTRIKTSIIQAVLQAIRKYECIIH